MLIWEDIKDVFKLILAIAIPVVLIIYLIQRCIISTYTATESSPTPMLELQDIQYKGHTYIYVHGTYSHTIVHAEHCKCKK